MPNAGASAAPARPSVPSNMIWIIAAFSLLLMAVDRGAVVRMTGDTKRRRRLTAAAWVTDILPFIFSGAAFLLCNDNPTWTVSVSMWVFFAYMLLAVARLPVNLAIIASRRRPVRIAGGVLSVAAAAVFIYGMAVTRTDYTVNRVEIVSERLPALFDGYTIVQISDLHIGSMVRPQLETERIVEICNSLNADAVAFCGDLVNIRWTEIDAVADLLGRLQARDGIYAVTGNHDLGVYVRDTLSLPVAENTRRVIEAERALGWHVLDNETTYLRRGGDSISLTGLSFDREWAEKRHSPDLPAEDIGAAYVGVPHSLFNITLAHIPQLWDDIVADGYGDLTLSGHVHSMQMKLRVGRRGISPAVIRYRRWSGLYGEGEHNLYINDGLGCVLFPVRIGARPEITLLVLRSGRGG